MEETIQYNPTDNPSYIWAESVMGKLATKAEKEFKLHGREAFYRLQSLFSEVISVETDKLIEQVRNEFYGSNANKTVKDIMIAVCSYYHVQPDDIMQRSRKRQFVEPRQLFCWLVHNRIVPNRLTYTQIADFLGGYNHATVLHCIKTINQRIETEQRFREDIMKILNDFGYRCSFTDGRLTWMLVNS